MSIEPGAIVMRNGRYGYQARIVRGDYAVKQEFTAKVTTPNGFAEGPYCPRIPPVLAKCRIVGYTIYK